MPLVLSSSAFLALILASENADTFPSVGPDAAGATMGFGFASTGANGFGCSIVVVLVMFSTSAVVAVAVVLELLSTIE
jgi:hypothetical protein